MFGLALTDSCQYPEENNYKKYLAYHSGHSNACTTSTSTNFYFEIAASASTPTNSKAPTPNATQEYLPLSKDESPLWGALDRFGQFFISPLFLGDTVDRKTEAVDSENKKKLQGDTWRLHQLNKALSDPNHPYDQFSTGSSKTLHDDTLARSVQIRDEFIRFYEEYYSANRMKLVVLGRENLDTLGEWVEEIFSKVPNKDLPRERWDRLEVEKKEADQPLKPPELIRNDKALRSWWKKDGQFWVPKANVHIHLRTPRTAVMSTLYRDLINDALAEYLYDADISGFVFRNWDFEQPYHQVGTYSRWFKSEKSFMVKELTKELDGVTARDVQLSFLQLLARRHIEVLSHGSLYKEETLKIIDFVEKTLRPRKLAPNQWPIRWTPILLERSNFIYERHLKEPANINHCIFQPLQTAASLLKCTSLFFGRLFSPYLTMTIALPSAMAAPNPSTVQNSIEGGALQKLGQLAQSFIPLIAPTFILVTAGGMSMLLSRWRYRNGLASATCIAGCVYVAIHGDKNTEKPLMIATSIIYLMFHVSYCRLTAYLLGVGEIFVIFATALGVALWGVVAIIPPFKEIWEASSGLGYALALAPLHLATFHLCSVLVKLGHENMRSRREHVGEERLPLHEVRPTGTITNSSVHSPGADQ